MFKPASLRSIPRSIPKQQVLSRGVFTGPRQRPTVSVAAAAVKRNKSALTAVGLLGGFVAYQLSTQPVVLAEAAALPAEDLESGLSAQHEQV